MLLASKAQLAGALYEPVEAVSQRVRQAQLIERWRPEVMCEPAYVIHRRQRVGLRVGEHPVGLAWVGVEDTTGGSDGQAQAGQHQSKTIVQITPRPASLLGERADRPYSCDLQGVPEPQRLGGRDQRRRQACHELPVAGGHASGAAWPHP